MIKKRIVLMIVIAVSYSTLHCFGQDSLSDALMRRVTSVEVTKKDPTEFLWKLAIQYDVPIGVEGPSTEDSQEIADDTRMEIKEGNVEQVLNAFVAVNPHYEWNQTDSAINVSPVVNKEPLLDVVLRDFKVRNATAGEIVVAIVQSPEVAAKLAEISLTLDSTTPLPIAPRKERPQFTLELHNISVRQILNHIIRTTSNRYWLVYRTGTNHQFIAIRLL